MTKVLPRVWCCAVLVTFILVEFAGAVLSIHPLGITLAAYFTSVVAGLCAGGIALGRNPEISPSISL